MTESDSSFEASLNQLGVSITRTAPSGVDAALDKAVFEPAVGVALDEDLTETDNPLTEAEVELDPTPAALDAARTGVSTADLGVADYGSLVLTLTESGSELVTLFVEHHVVLVHEADITPEMDIAVETLEATLTRTRGSAILATGPSATADMGALVKGAHGPASIHVIIIEEGM